MNKNQDCYDTNLLKKLNAATAGLTLTDTEKRTLKWLTICETRTVNNIISIIEKAKGSAK